VTAADIVLLLPLETLGLAAVVVMLLTTFWPSHEAALGFTLAGLAASLVVMPITTGKADRSVGSLLVMDDTTLLFMGLVVFATAGVAIMSYLYLRRGERYPLDFYTVLLISTFGAVTLIASVSFVSFFIGLEILSVSLYVLIGYPRLRGRNVEAAVKYLILAAATAATLLFGMALAYAVTGHLDFAGLFAGPATQGAGEATMFVVGVTLIFVGVGFKLALVPFHMWTPDIYQGAPAPVTAFVATVSKAAVVALLLRFLYSGRMPAGHTIDVMLTAVSMASMIAGNLLALLQDNVKRILGYSSIAQMGYLLVPFVAGGKNGAVAVTFFLVAYVATMLAAFGIVTLLSGPEREAESMEDYRGLAARRPWLAAAFAVVLLSLAGIPLTGGFIGKFYLVRAGAGASLWALLVVLVLTSAVSLYYYTRIIVTMYAWRPEDAAALPAVPGTGTQAAWAPMAVPVAERTTAVVLVVFVVGLLVLGTYPSPLLRLIEHALAGML
jgi:NADH-quinone oxidoreductase subunit N